MDRSGANLFADLSEKGDMADRMVKRKEDIKYLTIGRHGGEGISGIARKFSDPAAEQAFRKNYNKYVIQKARLAFSVQFLLNILVLVLETSFNTLKDNALASVISFRISILLCCAWGYSFTKYPLTFEKYADTILPLIYLLIGFLLIFMYSTCSYIMDHEYSPYLFHEGRLSLPNSLTYLFIIFNTSGLKYQEAFILGSLHTTAFISLPFLIGYYHHHEDFFISPFLVYLPVMLLISMFSSHDQEWQVRQGFLLKCDIGEDLQRQDALILSILPKEITDALKANRIENLAKYYDNVTILFCYIVDFGKNSSSTHSQDLVGLLIRVITMFDRLVNLTSVYKVENIAETYMCVGGCPQVCDDHAVRIARMALAMMEAVQICGWRWPDGTPIQLQIGIHTGHCVAGVVGSKSYSYHLFGDSVNTSSRMCSHSMPGRIQLSESAYHALEAQGKGQFTMECRGPIDVKGKGLMTTYFLHDYETKISLREMLLTQTHSSVEGGHFLRGMDRFAQGNSTITSRYKIRSWDLKFLARSRISPDENTAGIGSTSDGGDGKDKDEYNEKGLDQVVTSIRRKSTLGGKAGSGRDANGNVIVTTASERSNSGEFASAAFHFLQHTPSMANIFKRASKAEVENNVGVSGNIVGGDVNSAAVTPQKRNSKTNISLRSMLIEKHKHHSVDSMSSSSNGLIGSSTNVLASQLGKNGVIHENEIYDQGVDSSDKAGISPVAEEEETQAIPHMESDEKAPMLGGPHESSIEAKAASDGISARRHEGLTSSSMLQLQIDSPEPQGRQQKGSIINNNPGTPFVKNRPPASSFLKSFNQKNAPIAPTGELTEESSDPIRNSMKRTKHSLSFLKREHNKIGENQRRPSIMSVSDDGEDNSVDLADVESRFRLEYNVVNIEHFRRMLVVTLAISVTEIHMNFYDTLRLLRFGIASGVIILLLLATHILNMKKRLQSTIFFSSVLLFVIGGASFTDNFTTFKLDKSIQSCSEFIICLVTLNLYLRLQYIPAAILSVTLLLFALINLLSGQLFVMAAFSAFVHLTSLYQVYQREKGLRKDFLHLYLLEEERIKSQKLLENMLPSTHHADKLLRGDLILDELHDVTLLYSDMKGFTVLSAQMDPRDLCTLLNIMYSSFDKHLDHFGLYKIDTIGDAFVVMGGLQGYKSEKSHALACVQFALHMQSDIRQIRQLCNVDVQLRIGIHTGSVMGSVVSLNKPRYLVWGPTTLAANAMESNGIPDETMISYETKLRLDQEEMARLNISMTDREPNPKIQKYTRSAHMIVCNDMSAFIHNTWPSQIPRATTELGSTSKSLLQGIARRLSKTDEIPVSSGNNPGSAPGSTSSTTNSQNHVLSTTKSSVNNLSNLMLKITESFDLHDGKHTNRDQVKPTVSRDNVQRPVSGSIIRPISGSQIRGPKISSTTSSNGGSNSRLINPSPMTLDTMNSPYLESSMDFSTPFTRQMHPASNEFDPSSSDIHLHQTRKTPTTGSDERILISVNNADGVAQELKANEDQNSKEKSGQRYTFSQLGRAMSQRTILPPLEKQPSFAEAKDS